MKIDITPDEIEAIRIISDWGLVEGSWAHTKLLKLYDKIVEEQKRQYNKK